MSPSDLGEVLKPFVFLDLAVFDPKDAPMPIERGWHPHSGIATVTVMLDGAIRFAETTGKSGELRADGVEFMRAGNGVWHTGTHVQGRAAAFQLWIALPPELENGTNASHYVVSEDVPVVGPARVILGSYGGKPHPHELHLGNYSVHTSLEALIKGELEIRRIGQRLAADGTLRR